MPILQHRYAYAQTVWTSNNQRILIVLLRESANARRKSPVSINRRLPPGAAKTSRTLPNGWTQANVKTGCRGIGGAPGSKSFRQRYEDLELSRAQLLTRLERHMKVIRTHPSAKRALKLLNDTFRSASVAQRAAILQAAEWLISLIEMTPPMI